MIMACFTAYTILYGCVLFLTVPSVTAEDQKRLLMNDPEATMNLIHQLQLEVQKLKTAVSSMQNSINNESKIGFHAELSTHLDNLPHDTIIVFDRVVTNDGGAYDSSAGVFDCPQEGLYSFSWTTLTDPGHIFHTLLTVNGRKITLSHNNAANMSDGKTATKNAVVHLKQGDKVWIKTYQSFGHLLHADWSSFCGFKI